MLKIGDVELNAEKGSWRLKLIFKFRKTEDNMYLDKILGSKTKINILAILVNAKDKEFAESELAKEIGCSLSEVNRQIPLEKSELKEHLKFAEDLFFKVKSVVKF